MTANLSWEVKSVAWRRPANPDKFYAGIKELAGQPVCRDILWRSRIVDEEDAAGSNPRTLATGPSSHNGTHSMKLSAAGFLFCDQDVDSARSAWVLRVGRHNTNSLSCTTGQRPRLGRLRQKYRN